MTSMRAVIATEPGGPEVLQVVSVPRPVPGPGEVLIAVHAAGVNRADVYQRMGLYDPPPGATSVLGLECAGVIAACGPGVTSFRLGERVCALLPGGGYAEFVAAPVEQVAAVPVNLSSVQAAGVMEAAATVWSNVFDVGRLTSDETLLIHGGASGIGTMAVQIAKAAGVRVAVTAGSDEKLEVCRQLGADILLNYRSADFADVLAGMDVQADVILDIIGGSYLAQNIRSLAVGGRLVVIGLQGGVLGELDLGLMLRKRATIAATSLRARPVTEKASIVASTVAQVWPIIIDGRLTPIIHETFGLDEVAAAHQMLEDSAHVGKMVLEL